MKPRHQVSRAAIDLIKRFEGYRQKSAQLPDGRWTIGYGHTLTARQGAEVSEQDAEALLLYDLISVAHSVNEWTYTPLTQNQFDSLCCFAFNIGLDNFRRSSVLRRINEGSLLQAACAMELWRKADFEGERIVIDALVRRRSAEKTLFLTPPGGGWVPAPSPILRPNVDADSLGAVPQQAPTVLHAPMTGDKAILVRDAASAPRPAAPEAEQSVNPQAAAAAQVSSRLQTIFADPEPAAPAAPQPAPQPAPVAPPVAAAFTPAETPRANAGGIRVEPHPQADVAPPQPVAPPPDDLAAPPPPAPRAMAAGERPFTLTPPEEELEPRVQEPVRMDLVAANESGPGLFDRPFATAANDPLDAPPPPQASLQAVEPERRIVIDDLASDYAFDPAFGVTPEQPRGGFVLLITLAVLGLALFAGGLFWGFNARPGGGLMPPGVVAWAAGIAGIGFFGTALYLMLVRLGRAGAELEHEDELTGE